MRFAVGGLRFAVKGKRRYGGCGGKWFEVVMGGLFILMEIFFFLTDNLKDILLRRFLGQENPLGF